MQTHRQDWGPDLRSLAAAVLAVSGILSATALVNLSTFGIPVFFAGAGFAALAVACTGIERHGNLPLAPRPLLFLLATAVVLNAVFVAQIAFGVAPPRATLSQFVMRNAFLFYFAMILAVATHPSAFRALRNAAIIALFASFIYGIYETIAQALGLPPVLSFLRNNVSYGADRPALFGGGWLPVPRAAGFWSEPSDSALPVCFALYWLWYLSSLRRRTRRLLLFVILAFLLLTFSRSAWVAVVGAAAAAAFYRLLARTGDGSFNKLLLGGIALATAILPVLMPMLLALYTTSDVTALDASALERAAGQVAGIQIFLDHPLLGVGHADLGSTVMRYAITLRWATWEHFPSFTYNGFISWAAAMGLGGIVVAMLPLWLIYSLPGLDATRKAYWLAAIVLSFSSGYVMYFSFFWLFLALVALEPQQAPVPAAAQVQRPGRLRPQPVT